MLGLLLIATLPSPAPDGLTLEDVRQFGLTPHVARTTWLMARDHPAVMRPIVAGGWHNDERTVAAWEVECNWRARAWYLLDDVLFCNYPPAKKLQSLADLRQMLGDEAFFSGRMPSPFPAYRGLSR